MILHQLVSSTHTYFPKDCSSNFFISEIHALHHPTSITSITDFVRPLTKETSSNITIHNLVVTQFQQLKNYAKGKKYFVVAVILLLFISQCLSSLSLASRIWFKCHFFLSEWRDSNLFHFPLSFLSPSLQSSLPSLLSASSACQLAVHTHQSKVYTYREEEKKCHCFCGTFICKRMMMMTMMTMQFIGKQQHKWYMQCSLECLYTCLVHIVCLILQCVFTMSALLAVG